MDMAIQPYVHQGGNDRSIWYQGSLLTVKVSGEQIDHAFGLIDELVPPGFATPLHIHHREDESFYIIDGDVSFVCGDACWTATTGSFVFLPRKVVHGFKARRTTRMLNFLTPGGFEHFFVDLGEPALAQTLPPVGSPPDIARLVAAASRYQVEIVGPPIE